MVCVYCGHKTKVINSRRQLRNNRVWRRRSCPQCGAVFTTGEGADLALTHMVVTPRGLKPFKTEKLYSEVLLALQDLHEPYSEAQELTSTIIARLLKEGSEVIEPRLISKVTAEVLKRFSRQAWLRYSAEHPSLTV